MFYIVELFSDVLCFAVFQGMLGNSMPMSPESLSPVGKPGSPYYSYSKRQQIEESLRGKKNDILFFPKSI